MPFVNIASQESLNEKKKIKMSSIIASNTLKNKYQDSQVIHRKTYFPELCEFVSNILSMVVPVYRKWTSPLLFFCQLDI